MTKYTTYRSFNFSRDRAPVLNVGEEFKQEVGCMFSLDARVCVLGGGIMSFDTTPYTLSCTSPEIRNAFKRNVSSKVNSPCFKVKRVKHFWQTGKTDCRYIVDWFYFPPQRRTLLRQSQVWIMCASRPTIDLRTTAWTHWDCKDSVFLCVQRYMMWAVRYATTCSCNRRWRKQVELYYWLKHAFEKQ